MLSAETARTFKPLYAGEEGQGWILGWDLLRSAPDMSARADEAAELWVFSLLETVSLPRTACTWMGWDASDIRLPGPWRPDDRGPVEGRWSEARLFHPRLELRLQRLPAVLRLRLLTEEESLRTAAEELGRQHMPPSAVAASSGAFRTVPGQVLLIGRALNLDSIVPEDSLGEVQYPRLLRYRTPDGPPRTDDPSGRVSVQVTRYFDRVYRLRAVRYRAWKA